LGTDAAGSALSGPRSGRNRGTRRSGGCHVPRRTRLKLSDITPAASSRICLPASSGRLRTRQQSPAATAERIPTPDDLVRRDLSAGCRRMPGRYPHWPPGYPEFFVAAPTPGWAL